MQEKSESQILWEVFEDVRGLTKFYAIRHEPCHTGQISWLLKMADVETV